MQRQLADTEKKITTNLGKSLAMVWSSQEWFGSTECGAGEPAQGKRGRIAGICSVADGEEGSRAGLKARKPLQSHFRGEKWAYKAKILAKIAGIFRFFSWLAWSDPGVL
jgi:hypothetical protein